MTNHINGFALGIFMLLASSLLNTNTVPIVSLLQLQRWATSQNRLVPRGGVSFVRQRVAPFSVLLVIGITVLYDLCGGGKEGITNITYPKVTTITSDISVLFPKIG